MVLENIVGSGLVVGVAVLAVLWKYGALPKIDWSKITAGILLVLTAEVLVMTLDGITAIGLDLSGLGILADVVEVIGVIAVLVGVLQNALSQLK